MTPHAVDRPTLSVVVPSHARADLLQLCLTSLREHAPASADIIVVDDGSADAVITRTAGRFPAVTVIRHPKPLGFCRAANAGIAAATGEVVQLLNDDAQVTAGWADAALARFADPAVGSVAPLVFIGPNADDPPRIDSAGDEYDNGGFAHKRGHGRPMSEEYLTPCEVFGASGSSAFYRRDVLQRVGAYPEGFGSYFEDVDLAWRIRRAGFRTMYEPASVVWHLVGSSHRKRRRLSEQQSRNEERVFWRNVPSLRDALPRHAAVLVGKAVRRLREGTFWPFAFGRLRAFSELPALLRHRRAVNTADGDSEAGSDATLAGLQREPAAD